MRDLKLHQFIPSSHDGSKNEFLRKLFGFWFDAFVYNQIWEDPRIDIEALELDENSRILTIASGGCNALNYLLACPGTVHATDINANHVYFLNLKVAAAKYLPSFVDFFTFFGVGRGKNTEALYLRYIAPNLDGATRSFWESNTFWGGLLYGNRINFFRDNGIYNHSRNGYFLRIFHALSRAFGLHIEKVLAANSLVEQREVFDAEIAPFFENPMITMVGRLPITLFGLGIPPQQFEELKRELTAEIGIIDIFRERVRRLACEFPIAENYFAWQAFARRYDTEKRNALPEYLKEENFEKLKHRSSCLTTGVGSISDIVATTERGRFNRFVFLDAQDWMDQERLVALWSSLAEKAPSGSRVVFRTAGSTSPLETALPTPLHSRFHYDMVTSRQLFRRDRSSIYGGFHSYILK